MTSSPNLEHESFARRHRGGVLLERIGVDLYPHPYLGFTLPRGHRSAQINIDDEGFRLSHAPSGIVHSESWLAGGGGGIVLGNSVAIGLAATSDRQTPASHLAHLTGVPQLNLGLCASVSIQENIAATPFLHAASTVVIIGAGTDLVNLMGSMSPDGVFPVVSFERPYSDLAQAPLFDLAALAVGEEVPELKDRLHTHRRTRRWDVAQAMTRIEEAARIRLRDLAVLRGGTRPGTQLILCLQPLATARTREITPAEWARFDFAAPVFGILQNAVEQAWGRYADLLAEGCAALGVTFLNLRADRFEGDTFADIVHFTDEGNLKAARLIAQTFDV